MVDDGRAPGDLDEGMAALAEAIGQPGCGSEDGRGRRRLPALDADDAGRQDFRSEGAAAAGLHDLWPGKAVDGAGREDNRDRRRGEVAAALGRPRKGALVRSSQGRLGLADANGRGPGIMAARPEGIDETRQIRLDPPRELHAVTRRVVTGLLQQRSVPYGGCQRGIALGAHDRHDIGQCIGPCRRRSLAPEAERIGPLRQGRDAGRQRAKQHRGRQSRRPDDPLSIRRSP